MKTTPSKKSTAPRAVGKGSSKAPTASTAAAATEAEEDMKDDVELGMELTPKKGTKKVATRSKQSDEDDEDLEEEEEADLPLEDEADIELDDEEAYQIDKDFEEFDLPKSKTKAVAGNAKKKGDNDLDDDFKDLGLDDLSRGGGFDDDDDDF